MEYIVVLAHLSIKELAMAAVLMIELRNALVKWFAKYDTILWMNYRFSY